MEGSFCIVDLSGFSALTEAHGDLAAADLAERFAELVEETLGGEGRVVKELGDAVLVVTPTPSAAVGFVSRLCARTAGEPNFPVLRAGLHHGEAVERGGDVFGGAVNLTARVVAQAGGRQVLATARVADAARTAGMEVTDLGPFALRNIQEPIEIFELRTTCSDSPHAIDPVCRMRVDPARATGRLRVGDSEYWFCSLDCAGRFAASPDAFVPQ